MPVAERLVVPMRAQRGRQKPIVYSGFRFDERGLEPVGTPTREQWSECLDYLMHVGRRIHFWIGDLLVYGERRWGEMYVEMIERTGYEIRTLRTLKWVAGQIDVSRRRDDLSFAHHQEAAGLSPDQQDAILARAALEGWTREMVRHAVNRLTYESERPDVVVVPGLHHGDCREVMQTLPDESIDLLLTAPPHEGPADVDALDTALACATTKLKPNSHVYVLATWQTYPEVAAVVERCFDLRNTLTWVKDIGETAGGHDNYGDQYEVILFAHKGRRHLNGRRDGDVVHFDCVATPQHPAEKPVELLQYLIGKSTQEQETVLDPFMNVGSTCLAASRAKRGFVGIERDRGWYDQAVRRLSAARGT
jgi:DNA methylase